MSNLRLLGRLSRAHIGSLAVLTALRTLVAAFIPQLIGLLLRSFFNTVSGGAAVGFHPLTICALIVAAAIARAAAVLTEVPVATRLRFRLGTTMRKNMLEHILGRPGAQALSVSPGDATNRFRDDADQTAGLVAQVPSLVSALGTSAVALAIMIRINARMALLVTLPLAAVMFIARQALTRVHRYRKEARDATGAVSGMIAEVFGAIEGIKVSGAEGSVADRFASVVNQRMKAVLRDTLFQCILWALFVTTSRVSTGVILLVAAGAMRSGSFTVGDFALFVYYLELVGEFPTQVAQVLVGLKQTSVALRRMDELMTDAPAGTLARGVAVDLGRDPPDVPVYTKAPTDLLRDVRVEGLTFRYGGDGRGVSGVSFALARGSLTLVVGRVGSGKTTLLRAFLGLLPASSGTWYWNGTEVDDPSVQLRPPRVAYTPQVPRLFSESLRDNILMGLHGETVDLMGAVRAAALEGDIADLERGMDTIVGPRGTRLSGGQIQRSAAARMFVRDPELLVFDDLSSALDVKTERVLWESLSKLLRARSATCLAVSHRREALRHADRILLLRDGCVSAMGSPAELMETCPDLRELFPEQEG